MTFKIAFIDPGKGNYTPETPRRQPLGGSQSALCYLAEALAAAGHPVTLINGTRGTRDVGGSAGLVRGVRCLPMSAVSTDDLRGFDIVVLLNGCATAMLTRLRAVLDRGQTLILWVQHAVDEPAVRDLAEPEARACLDGFAFVSLWQKEGYLKAFGLDPGRCHVLRNGFAPAFADLFPGDTDVAAAKPWPPVLAYTSTPFRGLDALLDGFPRIRAAIPGTRLRVFSSLEGYQVPAGQDPYTALYRRCRETEGVDYLGGVSQETLAEALRGTNCLAYLNRFAETSCIAVMEAMAAGCLVLSSQLGALHETGAGFARLIPVPQDPAEHARLFAEAAQAVLAEQRADPAASGRRLRAQVDHVNAAMNWSGRARDWLAWLARLARLARLEEPAGGKASGSAAPLAAPVTAPPAGAVAADDSAAARVTAAVAQAQRQLVEALGLHLNAGARGGAARRADPRWQEEARSLIALVEGSLRLDHNDEETRTGVWTTLKGYDAWLGYVTAVPDLPGPAGLPPGGRRVYDCFQFYNELDLLEVRLAELHPVVDRFVLVEATFTHAGTPKPLHYAENRERFAAYADKIIHVVVDDDPGGFAWQREAHQREAIARGLGGCAPGDMILISDADEIAKAPVVERLRREPDEGPTLFALHFDIFLYFLDLKSPEPWVSVAAAPWELIRRIGPNRARYLTKQGIGRTIAEAGWHFTWMGGIDRFRAKLEAYAHREMIAGIDRDPANLRLLDSFYATGGFEAGDVPGMWTDLVPVPIDERYPARIRRTLPHFRRLGWLRPQPVPAPGTLLEAGRAHEEAGRADRAEAAYRRAAAVDPAFIQAFHALAECAARRSAHGEAIGPLRACVALDPSGTHHLFVLAHSLLVCRRHGEAVAVLRELVRRDPGDHRIHANLGVALKNLGRPAEAVAAGRHSLAIEPSEPGVLSNIGLALSLQPGREEEAARTLSRAVRLDPGLLDARLNLALALRNLRRLDEAEAQCRRIIDARPDHAEAHTLLGTCLLLGGELEKGFREYEWRSRLAGGQVAPRGLPTPAWDGRDLEGRTILLHDEQGLGDGIQFVRYAPLLRRRGARVIVECNDLLLRLFGTLPGVDGVFGRSSPTPPHDVHAALMSLPHLLGTGPASVPAEIPYLSAEPELARLWRDRLGPRSSPSRLRVGLVWAGNPDYGEDRRRSPGLEALLPLTEVEGVDFIALQKGAGRQDLERLRTRLPASFADPGAAIADFADSAAIIAALDLVVSVDSSPAHLAGAMGAPVWTVLPSSCDWRWLVRGAANPWYPTMRLFRQERAGDWAPVVAELRAALTRMRP